MLFSLSNVKKHAGTLQSDRCARSGLKSPMMSSEFPASFSTIYTTNIEKLATFYRELLGEKALRIEGKDMLVFGNEVGSIVIKQVGKDSKFAEMAGKQSLGIVGSNDKYHQAGEKISDELGWDTDVSKMSDPDGNIILVASAEQAYLREVKSA